MNVSLVCTFFQTHLNFPKVGQMLCPDPLLANLALSLFAINLLMFLHQLQKHFQVVEVSVLT